MIAATDLVAAALLATTLLPAPPSRPAAKLVHYGSGVPDTQYARDHWREIERLPFDGAGIHVAIDRAAWAKGDRSTRNRLGRLVTGRRPFSLEDFREAIEDLRAARWQLWTENFLPVSLSAPEAPPPDWFDDPGWAVVVENLGVVAAIAREGHLRGILLDPEHYGPELFRYRPGAGRAFPEVAAAARRRGREAMEAIARERPGAVVLCFFGQTLPLAELRRGRTLEQAEYGLLAPFFDGMIEGASDGVRLVDGYEFAYGYTEGEQFRQARARIEEAGRSLSAVPERYRRVVEAGFGIWLDYGGDPAFRSPAVLARTLREALLATDGYVWLYSEGLRFYPPSADAEPILAVLRSVRRAKER
jgi:hypothetical protein